MSAGQRRSSEAGATAGGVPREQEYKNANDFAELARAMLPQGFGRERAARGVLGRAEERSAAPLPAVPREEPAASLETAGLGETSLPVTHEVQLKQHRKLVCAVDVERSGARMVTGSHDCSVAFWDFAGMDANLVPFRFVEPAGSYPVRFLRFSTTGEWLVAGSTASTPRLLDRHGSLITEFHKGDPYLRDMKNTSGHVGALHSADWHPSDRDLFITSGQDGTVRLWNSNGKKGNVRVMVVRSLRPGQKLAAVTQARFLPDGSAIACAVSDGSVRIYPSKDPWVHPAQVVADAHAAETDTTSMAVDRTGRYLCTRGGDDTLKLWDIRSLKQPVGVAAGLPNMHLETSCVFSPDGQMVATGTSARRGHGSSGTLAVFDALSLHPVRTVPVTESSVVAVNWHPALNQIMCGNGDGTVTMLYSPAASKKGALLPIQKAPAAASTEAFVGYSQGGIQTPNALPLFKTLEGRSLKRIRIKARQDPVKSHRPELPVDGPGAGGRLGSSVTQSIMKSIIKDTRRDEDPREALLKFAEIAEKDPKFVSPAYQLTQPQPILDSALLEREAAAEERRAAEEQAAAALSRKISSKK